MKHRMPPLLHWGAVALALLGGVGEFVSLQRWRISERRIRH
ncbi:hypothetical protein [Ramlibacter sp.]|nr:hypothetical protein [Ramlibacter sp.]